MAKTEMGHGNVENVLASDVVRKTGLGQSGLGLVRS